MEERKRFSMKREAALRNFIDSEITKFRIFVLRGGLSSYNDIGKDQVICKELSGLPDKVAKIYRSYIRG